MKAQRFVTGFSGVRRAACALVAAAMLALYVPAALAAAPTLSDVFPDDEILTPGTPMPFTYNAGVDGTLKISVYKSGSDAPQELPPVQVKAGKGAVPWDGMVGGKPVQPGDWIVRLTLVDADGASSEPQAAGVEVAAAAGETAATPAPAKASQEPTPSPTQSAVPSPAASDSNAGQAQSKDEQPAATQSVKPTGEEQVLREPGEGRQLSEFPDPHTLCYWGLDIDNLNIEDPADQAKIWEVLMQPVTVLNVGPMEHVYPLVSPDADPKDPENMTGQLHGETAGVHVLQKLDNGWSLIEAFSADGYGSPDDDKFHELDNRLIHGYVRTKLLKTVKPYADIGLVIDKYTQRMYIFKQGKLFTTLLVSTGFPTESRSWNETPSGEYMIDSWVGMFPNTNMECDMAIRINGGCLIHEVPFRPNADGTRNYGPFEPYLGQKASHGCVRVQRMKNNEGVNMAWLWKNLKRDTHVLILDDEGRATIPVPDSARTVYYNPNGGKSYHNRPDCPSVKERFLPLSPLPYEQLFQAPTDKLVPCYGCEPFFKVPDPNAAIPDDAMGPDSDAPN